jgi:hypothetical protein
MAPQLNSDELAQIRGAQSQGQSTKDIVEMLQAGRAEEDAMGPSLSAVRKAMTGKTHTGAVETRGRKRKLSDRAVAAINTKRKDLIAKADGCREIKWEEVIQKSRVRKVHATTAQRSLKKAGIDVAARAPRQKPQLDDKHKTEAFLA